MTALKILELQGFTADSLTEVRMTQSTSMFDKVRHLIKIKQCYRNADALLKLDLGDYFVLGFMIFHDLPIEHAWIVKSGKHYDLTGELLLKDNEKIEENTYYEVCSFSKSELDAIYSKGHDGYLLDLYSAKRLGLI